MKRRCDPHLHAIIQTHLLSVVAAAVRAALTWNAAVEQVSHLMLSWKMEPEKRVIIRGGAGGH